MDEHLPRPREPACKGTRARRDTRGNAAATEGRPGVWAHTAAGACRLGQPIPIRHTLIALHGVHLRPANVLETSECFFHGAVVLTLPPRSLCGWMVQRH